MNKYQKALNVFKTYGGFCKSEFDYQHKHYSTAVHALQELVDKATPMRPSIAVEDMDFKRSQYGFDYYVCPNCSSTLYEDTKHLKIKHFQDYYNQDIEYCHLCGQRLDWSEENE